MDALQTSRIVKRVIAEVAGTIATNGIQGLSREERGGVSDFIYVRSCLVATAYNSVRAYPSFNMSYNEFWHAVEEQTQPGSVNVFSDCSHVADRTTDTRGLRHCAKCGVPVVVYAGRLVATGGR